MINLTLNLNIKKSLQKEKLDIENISAAELKSELINTLKKYRFSGRTEINIHIIDEIQIKKLNKKWRDIDKTTDVLSFGQIKIPGENIRQLGDIFVCWNIAKQQAKNKNCSIQKEIEFLSCHGLKHLIGIHHE